MILAFDTSAAHCAAVILSGEAIIVERRDVMARGQAERLFPMLEDVLRSAGADWTDLEALAVGTGPGNFTGLRVAVAAARGLALSTGLPVHGVDGFAARAEGAQGAALIGVAAPRDRAHVRRWGSDANPEILTLTIAEAEALAQAEGLALLGEVFDTPPACPIAEAVARVAQRAARGAGPPPGRPAPLYIRPPDAAPSRHAAPPLLS